MSDDKDTRKRLLALLDRALFDPILQRRREEFDAMKDKRRFGDVKRKVAEERQRYHDNWFPGPKVTVSLPRLAHAGPSASK